MNEIIDMYNHQLFEALKERVKGHIKIKSQYDTYSIYILIRDGNIKCEYGVFNLDEKALNGTFNLEQEVNGIIKNYTKRILQEYLK